AAAASSARDTTRSARRASPTSLRGRYLTLRDETAGRTTCRSVCSREDEPPNRGSPKGSYPLPRRWAKRRRRASLGLTPALRQNLQPHPIRANASAEGPGLRARGSADRIG